MAFGFGFNKQKVLSAAEKFVQQGKLQNAISEYEKILKADPKDLTVMNTVGDLYARFGNADKAVECFKSVGDAYASQGFTVKAIAMYKKLTKMKSSLDSVLRLAELYTQQGLFNDARAQYLQVAEEFLKDNQLEQAVRIFQKTLEMDPENVAMRTRLAEVYLRLGKNQDAWQIFSAVTENLRSKGQLSAADEILRRMLKLDPGNSQALLLRGKNAFESGDIAGAAQQLEKVADLDNHPEGLKTLLQAYLQLGDLAQAGTLAEKLLTVHNDAAAFLGYIDALIAEGQFEQVLRLCQQHADRFLSANAEKVLEKLHMMIGHVRENTAALETLLDLLGKAGETTHLTEIYELLAHAYVQSGDFEKAQSYYLRLTQLEPENQLHAQNYQQVVAKLGPLAPSRGISAQEGAAMVDELEATAPFIEQRHDDDVELAIRAALTDAELFVSYNMPAKALGPLVFALPRAPRDLRINQRLAALFTRAGQFAEAAACCRTLESIYHEAGCPGEASRYSQLAAKYEENVSSGTAAAPVAVAPAPAPVPQMQTPAPEFVVHDEIPEMAVEAGVSELEGEPQLAASAAAASGESGAGLFFHPATSAAEPEVSPAQPIELQSAETSAETLPDEPQEKEIDLSREWECEVSEEAAPAEGLREESLATSLLEGQAPVSDSRAQTELIEEIRFYLDQNMAEEAQAAFVKLEQLNPEPYVLDGIRDAIEAAVTKAPAEAVEAEPVAVEEPQPPVWEEHEPAAAAAPEIAGDVPTVIEPQAPETVVAEAVLAESAVSKVATVGPAVPAEPSAPAASLLDAPESQPETEPVETPAAAPEPQGTPTLNQFVSELEASLGDSFPAEAPVAPVLPQFVSELEASLGDSFLAEVPVVPQSAPEPPPSTQSEPTESMPHMPVVVPAAEPFASASANAASTAATAAAPAMEPETAPAAPLFTYQPSKQRQLGEAAGSEGDAAARVDLMGMFGELKEELEQDQAAGDDDPETHYNLGVGFREMGLLEEAIGEFQKVCQAIDRGYTFPQVMQTYTWLAQCFLDKGLPEAAIRWYEKALKLPGIDDEAQTALHYELAAAHETAGNRPAALDHFTVVYASNIDYRGVAERIQALKS